MHVQSQIHCPLSLQSVSIGYWEADPIDTSASSASLSSSLPTSPVYGVATGGAGGVAGGGAGAAGAGAGAGAGTTETPELILEYWSPKGQKEKVITLWALYYEYNYRTSDKGKPMRS